jgi:hypothetical protein
MDGGHDIHVHIVESYDCSWLTYGGRQAQEGGVGHSEWGEQRRAQTPLRDLSLVTNKCRS